MAKAIINVDIDLNTDPIEKLEQELESVNNQLKKVEQGSDEFKVLSSRAGEVTNALNKANTAAEGFTDDKKFLAADGAIKAMAGSVSGVVGALGLLGVESEAFGDMEKKAASAIAVAIGIKDVSEGFKQLKQSTILATAAQKAYSVAVSAGNKIMKLFNITMAMNPIGALIAALGIVGGLVFAFRDKILQLIKTLSGPFSFIIDKIVGAFTKMGEAIGLVDDAQTKQTKANIERMEEELAVANAKGEATLQMEKDLLLEKRKLLKEGSDEYKQSITDEKVLDAKMVKEKEDKEKEIADKRLAIQKENAEKLAAQRKAQLDQEFQEYKAHLERMTNLDVSNIEELGKIRQEFFEKNLDKEVTNEETRIELEREKQLKRIEELGLNEGLTRQAIFEINKYYDGLQSEYQAGVDQDRLDKEKELEEQRKQIKLDALQTASELFGQETALGKAALIAKQFLLAQEFIMNAKAKIENAKDAVANAVVTGAEASTEVAGSVAKAANTAPPPFNVPFILSAISTGAGILASVKAAIGATKEAGGMGGGANLPGLAGNTGAVGSIAAGAIPSAATTPPQPTIVQPTVRAYVISGDVSSSQEADARLNKRRSLG